jgi:hypothetical protein
MFFILLHGVQQVALYTVSLPVAHPMKTKKSTCSTEDAKKIWRCERGDHHSNSVPDRGRPLPEIDGKVKYSNKNPSAVYDMPAIEALNSVSSNPILLFTCRNLISLKPYSFQEDSHTYILKPIGLTCGVCV